MHSQPYGLHRSTLVEWSLTFAQASNSTARDQLCAQGDLKFSVSVGMQGEEEAIPVSCLSDRMVEESEVEAWRQFMQGSPQLQQPCLVQASYTRLFSFPLTNLHLFPRTLH